MRIDRDQLGLLLASAWAERGTCARRRVGCVLVDVRGQEVGTGYNGPPSGHPHCRMTDRATDRRCLGADLPSGTGLELCEAVHAEQNALMFCRDPMRIHVAYVTHSPCLHCVKLLMNTSCRRIVFAERYSHDEGSRGLWVDDSVPPGLRRTWEHAKPRWRIEEVRT